MDRIIDAAAYMIKKYKDVSAEQLDEMKLHKLLYFTQRESFAITSEPAFEGTFEGWKYGPVCREIRSAYCDGKISVETNDISDMLKYIINNVILEYGSLESWKLSELSHKDSSWKNARTGLSRGENGDIPLKVDDIKADACKVRPYDHVWDMYYDEFDDEEALF